MTTTTISPNSKQLARIWIRWLDKRLARPSLKAFIIAYLYVTLPKILNQVIISIRKKKYHNIVPQVVKIINNATHPRKFPMFSAYLVGSINLLEPIVYQLLKKYNITTTPINNLFFSTLISSFISALVTFPSYQNHILGYGRYYSLDLTLLVVTRALDTALTSSLSKITPAPIAKYGDALLFIVSCSFIMFAWFYRPQALPPTYRKWITSAANMDQELLEALKGLREGNLKYGEHCPKEDILKPYCERYGQDPRKGSLIVNKPIDCELVHAFQTKNCELHALWRFMRGFSFAIKIYGPLNALMLLFPVKNISMRKRIIRALKSSLRSSCFLGTFIALYWYTVCLARTRLFPRLFPNKPKTTWDVTIGPAAGSIACGLSSLIESAQRRKELALFVAPRALGTIIPTEASTHNLKIECFVFSLSMAILVAYSKSDPKKVRGIFGKGLQQVFNINYYK